MANPVLERQFGDAATAHDLASRSRMTIGSVLVSTIVLLALVVAGAVYGWANAAAVWSWWWLFAISLIVLVILTVANAKLAPITGVVYAVGQGTFVGALS